MKDGIGKIVRTVLAGTFALTGVAVLTPAAEARSVGAFAGAPLDNTPWVCYRENAGGVVGNSSPIPAPGDTCGEARWEVNLPVDSARGYIISFATAKDPAMPVGACCAAYATSPSGAFTSTNPKCGTSTTMTTIDTEAVTVVTGGHLFLACSNLRGTNKVNAVSWR